MSWLADEIAARRAAAARKVSDVLANEIDDAIAGLMVAGTPKEDITIQSFVATGETRILVCGEEKYRFRVSLEMTHDRNA